MQKIVLVSCGKSKAKIKTEARKLYTGSYFRAVLRYAFSLKPDKIFILSAKYGCIGLSKVIEPYNITLNTCSANDIKKWSLHVISQLNEVSDLNKDRFIILAGEKYRKYLIPKMKNYEIPLKNLRMGKQLNFLKKAMLNHE